MSIYRQASAIPFRFNNNELQVLILTSRNKKNWIIPKGLVDPGDSEVYTALKEAEEEAGVTGRIIDKVVGHYTYKKWNGICMVKVYPLTVETEFDTWDEMHFRKRKWVNARVAVKKIKSPEVSKIIKRFMKEMKNNAI